MTSAAGSPSPTAGSDLDAGGLVITAVLGGPGSGKSTLTSLLAPLLPAHGVLLADHLLVEPRRQRLARDGPEATAVRWANATGWRECYVCLDLGTIAMEDLCSEGGHSSGRLSEAS